MDEASARSKISSHLLPGERIVWIGTPSPFHIFLRNVFPFAFILFWLSGVTSIFTTGGFWAKNSDKAGVLQIVPVFLVGVGLVILATTLRPILLAWSTAYAITDRRVLIVKGSGRAESLSGDLLHQIERSGDSGQGSLYFGPRTTGRNFLERPAFIGIQNPRRVEALIYDNLIGKR